MLKIGQGLDVHAFTTGDFVTLGGIKIPHTHGIKAHSDGDVLLHALMDAMLGALAFGDIGMHFPDTDERWRGADSKEMLKAVNALIQAKGYRLINADMTVICELPKLSPHNTAMRECIANILQVEMDCISIKATTNEKMGYLGRGEGNFCKCGGVIAKGGLRHLLMNIVQTILLNLPKKSQAMIIGIVVMACFILFIAITVQTNNIQKKVNHRLLSGQEFDVNVLLPSAQIICIVPPKSRIYHEGEIRNYLTNSKVQQLNRKLNPVWRMFVSEWHLVGISNNRYQYYRMGDFVLPEYINTQCLSIKDNGKISIALTDVGSREFYIIQKGRSGHRFLK